MIWIVVEANLSGRWLLAHASTTLSDRPLLYLLGGLVPQTIFSKAGASLRIVFHPLIFFR